MTPTDDTLLDKASKIQLYHKWLDQCIESAEFWLGKSNFETAKKRIDRAKFLIDWLKENDID